MSRSCGLFRVESSFANPGVNCFTFLFLTMGGTGIPLLIVIVILSCALCCVCRRYRKRLRTIDAEKNGELGAVDSIPLTEISEQQDEVVIEVTTGELYGSDEVNPSQQQNIATVYAEIAEVTPKPVEQSEDVRVVTTGDLYNMDEESQAQQPNTVSVYEEIPEAKPKPKPRRVPPRSSQALSVAGEQCEKIPEVEPKPPEVPPHASSQTPSVAVEQLYTKPEKYSRLQRVDTNRVSKETLPEGMYSTTETEVPPLPPPLAEEDLPSPVEHRGAAVKIEHSRPDAYEDIDTTFDPPSTRGAAVMMQHSRPDAYEDIDTTFDQPATRGAAVMMQHSRPGVYEDIDTTFEPPSTKGTTVIMEHSRLDAYEDIDTTFDQPATRTSANNKAENMTEKNSGFSPMEVTGADKATAHAQNKVEEATAHAQNEQADTDYYNVAPKNAGYENLVLGNRTSNCL